MVRTKRIVATEEIKTAEDVLEAYFAVQSRAIEIGHPIVLGFDCSLPLAVYIHDDMPDYVVVDKEYSHSTKKCPYCDHILTPANTPENEGHSFVCHNCKKYF